MFRAGCSVDLVWHHSCYKIAMVIAALVIGVGIIMEICAVVGAPVGYQDDAGFHIGVENAECKDGRREVNPG
jgi:hypothetical protein